MATPEIQTAAPSVKAPRQRSFLRWFITGNAQPKDQKKEAAQTTHNFVVGTEHRDQRQASLTLLERGQRIWVDRLYALEPGSRRIITDESPESHHVRYRMLYHDPKLGLRGVTATKSRASAPTRPREDSGWDVTYSNPASLFDKGEFDSGVLILNKGGSMVDIGPKVDIGMPQPDLRDPYTREYNELLSVVEAHDRNLAKQETRKRVTEAALLAAEAALGL